MEYIIPKGKNYPKGLHFYLFPKKVISGTFILSKSALYSNKGLDERSFTSWNKITGLTNLLTFGKDSGRLAYRCINNSYFQIGSYIHDRGGYNVINNPARIITTVEPEEECYFRLEELDYGYQFNVNDAVLLHPKSTKSSILRYRNIPYIQYGDAPALQDTKIIINFK